MTESLTTHRGMKFRCYPTDEQAAAFRQMFSVRRFVWNHMHALTLGHERLSKAVNNGKWKKRPAWQSLAKHVNQKVAKKHPWIHQHAKQTLITLVAKDYDEAWRRFYEEVSNRPRFKGMRQQRSFSDRVKTNGAGHAKVRRQVVFEVDGGESAFQYRRELGLIRFVKHREIEGEIVSFTVSESAGRFFVSFCTRLVMPRKQTSSTETVGLDCGIAA